MAGCLEVRGCCGPPGQTRGENLSGLDADVGWIGVDPALIAGEEVCLIESVVLEQRRSRVQRHLCVIGPFAGPPDGPTTHLRAETAD
jgi:hypothetical protein